MVGSRGGVRNESEVFIPDVLHCTVIEQLTKQLGRSVY